ncbi:homeodomain-interacting protein kinase 3-like [Oryzias melastigma]|uniref:homeodomain-interacting protein kinase 3-like n=1 Tax=Oryzias melastigma TaxID=30732 RepID=UPI00168CFA7C|nr:homeodomain-interacting protein kinase 3-like [Oryzias melastigma]
MDIKEGTIIHSAKESYQLREFLDEGAFGTVMKGKKLETNEDVAIKIFKNNNKDILSLEFNALKRIQRIDADKYNLVKCIERFGYRRKVFIVFEMLDQSLHDFMRKRDGSPLSMSEIKTISWQLLVALKGLKSIGLVHTDIKPDNIMLVDSKSQPLRVKLIDFGLSLKLDDLITGSIFQTMPYRAPEVRLGLPLNEAIDMWALGHILTLLLTGSSLYPCDNDFNIIRAMVRMQGMPDSSLLEKALYSYNFFTEYEKGVWELDSPVEYAKKTGKKLKLNISKNYATFDEFIQKRNDPSDAEQVELFVNLLEQMLLIDPDRRITVEEALKHPFFAENNDDNKRIGEKVSGIAYTAPAQDCIHKQDEKIFEKDSSVEHINTTKDKIPNCKEDFLSPSVLEILKPQKTFFRKVIDFIYNPFDF